MRPSSAGNALRLLVWCGVLAAAALGPSALGRGPLSPPVLSDPASWERWATGRTPVEAAFAVLSGVVMAMAWYLLAVTALAAAGRFLRAGRLVRMADVLTLPLLRPAVHAVVGLGLVGTTVAGLAGGPSAGSGGRFVGAQPVSLIVATTDIGPVDPRGGGDAVDNHAGHPDSPPIMRRLAPEGPPVEEEPASTTGPANPVVEGEWEIRPGDHLWSVAARVLEQAWGMPASDAEVAPYWRRLVEANRDRLADRDNPDLVYPAQVVTVPAPPPAPR